MDQTLQALANSTRRRILDIVKASPGCTVSEVAKHFDTSRIAVMKHLRILEDANLLITEKQGRSRHLYQNLVPIQLVYDRWTDEYSGFWAGHMADLKYRLEQPDVKSNLNDTDAESAQSAENKKKESKK